MNVKVFSTFQFQSSHPQYFSQMKIDGIHPIQNSANMSKNNIEKRFQTRHIAYLYSSETFLSRLKSTIDERRSLPTPQRHEQSAKIIQFTWKKYIKIIIQTQYDWWRDKKRGHSVLASQEGRPSSSSALPWGWKCLGAERGRVPPLVESLSKLDFNWR